MENKEFRVKELYQNQNTNYENNVDIIHDIHNNYNEILNNFHKYNMELVSYCLNECKNALKWCILYFKRKFLRKSGLINDIFEYQHSKFVLSTNWIICFCLWVMEDLDKIVLLEEKIDKQIQSYKDNKNIEELNKWSLVEQKSNLQLIKTSYIAILKNVSVLFANPDFINIFQKLATYYFSSDEVYDDAISNISKITIKIKQFK